MAFSVRRPHEPLPRPSEPPSPAQSGGPVVYEGDWVRAQFGCSEAGYKGEHVHDRPQVAVFPHGAAGIASWVSASGLRIDKPFQDEHVWIVPAGVRHAIRHNKPTELIVVYPGPKFFAEIGSGIQIAEASLKPLRGYLEEDRFIGDLIEKFLGFRITKERPGPVYAEMLGGLLARHILRVHLAPGSRERDSRAGLSPTVLSRVVAHIRANYPDKLTRMDLARVAGQSEWHFARHFRLSEGIPPMRYLREWRLQEGRALLLASGKTIAEIAQTVGFGDHAQFTNQFRKKYGVSPSAYLSRKS